MATTVTVEKAQANLIKYLNQLDDGTTDKIIVQDAAENLFQIVTAAVYEAADSGSAAVAEVDVVSSYAVSPGSQGKSLYKMTKGMRNRQAAGDATPANGTITTVAKASISDGEYVTLTDAGGTAYTFEFDVTPDGVTTGNIAVDISGDTTDADVATTLAGVIDGQAAFSASANAAVVTVDQADPGLSGNVAIVEAVADSGFTVTGFAGGTDAPNDGGVVALKNSKNDTAVRAYMVPEDHAVAIGL